MPVVITEKLDGSNTMLYRGQVYGRGMSEPSAAKWYGMLKKWHAWKTYDDEDFIFGEDIYGLHSIAYDPVPEDATFYIFGVRRGGQFTDWATVEAKSCELSIPDRSDPVSGHLRLPAGDRRLRPNRRTASRRRSVLSARGS